MPENPEPPACAAGRSPPAVQEVPSYSSVLSIAAFGDEGLGPPDPPIIKEDVCTPPPPRSYLE